MPNTTKKKPKSSLVPENSEPLPLLPIWQDVERISSSEKESSKSDDWQFLEPKNTKPDVSITSFVDAREGSEILGRLSFSSRQPMRL